jgi:hypothetical protein
MTTKLKEKLASARETLSTALVASHAGDKQLAKLEQARTGVAAEIENLEVSTEANPTGEAAIARLSTLREQQRLFDKKIAKLQTEQLHDESPRIALAEALSDAVRLLIEAGKPTLDRLTEQATAALAPYYRPGAKLELAAQRCDAVLSLRAFLVNCGHGAELDKPTGALRLLDTLLAGEPLPWSWPLKTPVPGDEHAAT